MANVTSITGKEYIMYISKHDRNSSWLLKTVVSTVSENLMPKVQTSMEKYVMYGEKTHAISFTR